MSRFPLESREENVAWRSRDQIRKEMKIVPYDSLTKLQQAIAGWAGDSDGGCPWETAVEFLVEEGRHGEGYDELEIKKEIVNMVRTGILVGCVWSGHLHYPGWRPNECADVIYTNENGYETYEEKEIEVPDENWETEGYIVTLPDGTEVSCSRLSEVEKTGLSPAAVSKYMRGFGDIAPYKVRMGDIIKVIPGGKRKVRVDVFVDPPEEPFNYEKELLGEGAK